jgi:hypothetical protein
MNTLTEALHWAVPKRPTVASPKLSVTPLAEPGASDLLTAIAPRNREKLSWGR